MFEEFRKGAGVAAGTILAAAPFGALFGALAVDNGFTIFEAALMSAIVFAGASQLVGIELFGAQVAPWLIVFSIFAVNFRHILYSAVIGRRTRHFAPWQPYVAFFFLVDPHFAETERRAEAGERISFAWMMGGGITWWVSWVSATLVGAVFGGLIDDPAAIGVDFLLPIYFLGIVMGFRKRPRWAHVVVASAVGAILAYKFVGSPWHVSLGALCGVAAAALLGGDGAKRIARVAT